MLKINCALSRLIDVGYILSITLLVIACTAASAIGSSLLQNASFAGPLDIAGAPSGWALRETVEVVAHETGGPGDSPYLSITHDNTQTVWLESIWQPARPTGRYTASVWLRRHEGADPSLYINVYNSLGRRTQSVHCKQEGAVIEDGEDGWRRHTVEIELSEPRQRDWGSRVALMVWSPPRRAGTFDVAAAELTVAGGGEPLRGQERAAVSATPEPVDIGSRLELFVDGYMIDSMTPSASRRLHHPVPREVVIEFDQPWEGNTIAYLSLVEDGDRVLMYYNANPEFEDGKTRQNTCVIESTDGIHFTRPILGLVEFHGSAENNMLPRFGVSGHNFAVFLDENPDATEDERFKATGYGGFSVYGSPDGVHWHRLSEGSVISEGPFDSQNIAFWDPNIGQYVGYIRAKPSERRGVRDVRRTTSADFRTWSEPVLIDYMDDRLEHLYTNGIRPYFRAPHIYIGTPNRFVTGRRKVPEHEQGGINDVVLMASRDGELFERWEAGFIRPGPEPRVWTDRNNYPAWGMLQTSPQELSIYWTEHYRYPGMRVRRGTLRTDGFVSLHADATDVGEVLTRPFVFSGDRLEVNYATSAIGSIRFELCDVDGNAYPGFSLTDSDELFGNAIQHTVEWKGATDVSSLAGKPVRLRIRLHDADLYSFRFKED